MTLAGMQYTGSMSTRPGKPSSESPASPNSVWNTSATFPGLSAMPPASGSCVKQIEASGSTVVMRQKKGNERRRQTCAERMNAMSLSVSIQVILSKIDIEESTQKL